MRSSVSRSTAAVASSNTRIFVFLSRARARHTSCRCPTLGREKKTRERVSNYPDAEPGFEERRLADSLRVGFRQKNKAMPHIHIYNGYY